MLGLGMIGGSMLQALARGGYRVVGYDANPDEAAQARGLRLPAGRQRRGGGGRRDLVVLAMPLPDLPAALAEIRSALDPDAVLTDVGTLKTPVLPMVAELLPGCRFVGGHPLASTEESGFLASDPMLFRDAPWSLCWSPTPTWRPGWPSPCCCATSALGRCRPPPPNRTSRWPG